MSADYTLDYGTHRSPEDGRCAMEWVSHLAGEPHSDQPTCVSPVVRAFCIALNDGLETVPRQRLRPYLTRTIGTAGDGLDEQRAWMAMDWLIRTYTATWLSRGWRILCACAPVPAGSSSARAVCDAGAWGWVPGARRTARMRIGRQGRPRPFVASVATARAQRQHGSLRASARRRRRSRSRCEARTAAPARRGPVHRPGRL